MNGFNWLSNNITIEQTHEQGITVLDSGQLTNMDTRKTSAIPETKPTRLLNLDLLKEVQSIMCSNDVMDHMRDYNYVCIKHCR